MTSHARHDGPALRAFPAALCPGTDAHSQAELVVAPVSVTDHRGGRVEGLSGSDLILYDNNVARPIHVEDVFFPISLVLGAVWK